MVQKSNANHGRENPVRRGGKQQNQQVLLILPVLLRLRTTPDKSIVPLRQAVLSTYQNHSKHPLQAVQSTYQERSKHPSRNRCAIPCVLRYTWYTGRCAIDKGYGRSFGGGKVGQVILIITPTFSLLCYLSISYSIAIEGGFYCFSPLRTGFSRPWFALLFSTMARF